VVVALSNKVQATRRPQLPQRPIVSNGVTGLLGVDTVDQMGATAAPNISAAAGGAGVASEDANTGKSANSLPVLNLNLNDDSSSSTFASIAAAFLPSFLLPGGQDASQDAGQDAARGAGANASVKEVCWDCFVVDHFLDTQGQLINKKDMSAEQKARKSDPNPSPCQYSSRRTRACDSSTRLEAIDAKALKKFKSQIRTQRTKIKKKRKREAEAGATAGTVPSYKVPDLVSTICCRTRA